MLTKLPHGQYRRPSAAGDAIRSDMRLQPTGACAHHTTLIDVALQAILQGMNVLMHYYRPCPSHAGGAIPSDMRPRLTSACANHHAMTVDASQTLQGMKALSIT